MLLLSGVWVVLVVLQPSGFKSTTLLLNRHTVLNGSHFPKSLLTPFFRKNNKRINNVVQTWPLPWIIKASSHGPGVKSHTWDFTCPHLWISPFLRQQEPKWDGDSWESHVKIPLVWRAVLLANLETGHKWFNSAKEEFLVPARWFSSSFWRWEPYNES